MESTGIIFGIPQNIVNTVMKVKSEIRMQKVRKK